MRHAVVGAGGIGALLAAVLARGGASVLLLMRPESLARYQGWISVESAVLGDFEVEVPAVSALDRDVDFIWVATKAPQLESALAAALPDGAPEATVIPLLNGVDHIELLRRRYRSVVPGAIRVESERVETGRIRQTSPFLRVELAGAEAAAEDLRAAGVDCTIRPDELSLLWEKLTFLAPVALATTALDGPLGAVREDERFRGCLNEALAVARAEGAVVDETVIRGLPYGAPAGMRSSMQKDVEAGRPPELDAIAGPIIRGGRAHEVDVANTSELAALVAARAGVDMPRPDLGVG